jgi:hypothetical protein
MATYEPKGDGTDDARSEINARYAVTPQEGARQDAGQVAPARRARQGANGGESIPASVAHMAPRNLTGKAAAQAVRKAQAGEGEAVETPQEQEATAAGFTGTPQIRDACDRLPTALKANDASLLRLQGNGQGTMKVGQGTTRTYSDRRRR